MTGRINGGIVDFGDVDIGAEFTVYGFDALRFVKSNALYDRPNAQMVGDEDRRSRFQFGRHQPVTLWLQGG